MLRILGLVAIVIWSSQYVTCYAVWQSATQTWGTVCQAK